MVTTAGLSRSATSANDAAPAGAADRIVAGAATPALGSEWAGVGVRLPARTRPIIAPTAIARKTVMAANRRVMPPIIPQ